MKDRRRREFLHAMVKTAVFGAMVGWDTFLHGEAVAAPSISATHSNAIFQAVAARGNRISDSKSKPFMIVSEFSNADFKPDGDLKKKVWSTAKRVRFDRSAFSETNYPEIETVVASRWTARFLYLAFWCPYQSLNTYQGEDPAPERWELWKRDVVEAFINPQPQHISHYYEFEIAPNNQWLDLEIDLTQNPSHNPRWNSGFEHTTKIDSEHHVWTVEMRIPVLSMGVERLHPNVDWKINFYRCDGPGEDNSRRMLSWSPLPLNSPGSSFHQPASFGILHFTAPSGSVT